MLYARKWSAHPVQPPIRPERPSDRVGLKALEAEMQGVRLGVAAVFAGQSERAVGWCATDDDRSSPGPSSSGGVSHRLLGVDPVGPLPLRGPDPVPSSVPPSLGGPDVYTMSVSSRGAAGVVHGPGLLARLSSQVRLRPLEDRRCARSQVTLARSRCQWPRRARLAPGVRARAVP